MRSIKEQRELIRLVERDKVPEYMSLNSHEQLLDWAERARQYLEDHFEYLSQYNEYKRDKARILALLKELPE